MRDMLAWCPVDTTEKGETSRTDDLARLSEGIFEDVRCRVTRLV